MELTNSTPVPAKLEVAAPPGTTSRIGILVAKATFKFDLLGRAELDTQTPLPLLEKDEETPLGVLPSDSAARRGRRFEVILLGNAYPMRRPGTVVKVLLAVGKERRELMVFGDRAWAGSPPNRYAITQPAPFDKMPLVYERAFGGTVPVHIDRDTVVDIRCQVFQNGSSLRRPPETRGSLRNAQYAQECCRSKVQMSGLGKVEMSGSRYVTGHVGPGPDHEQTRVRARSFAAQSPG